MHDSAVMVVLLFVVLPSLMLLFIGICSIVQAFADLYPTHSDDMWLL